MTNDGATCFYTGKTVDSAGDDVEVSISREAVLEKIWDGDTRLTDS